MRYPALTFSSELRLCSFKHYNPMWRLLELGRRYWRDRTWNSFQISYVKRDSSAGKLSRGLRRAGNIAWHRHRKGWKGYRCTYVRITVVVVFVILKAANIYDIYYRPCAWLLNVHLYQKILTQSFNFKHLYPEIP